MKKVLALSTIVLALALAGCSGKSIQNENKAVDTNKPIIAEPTQNQVAESAIAEAGIKIQYPGDYSLNKSTELDRWGSFAAYEFLNHNKETESPVSLQEILILNRESVDKYAKNCAVNPWDCQVVELPSLESYNGQKEALVADRDYGQYKLNKFDNRSYLTASFKCQGDDCVLREYITFIADNQVKVIIRMGAENQAIEADELFQNFKIIE
jgi:hypothetical protein